MSSHPKNAIARILNGNHEVVGTGFLVSDKCLFTCAHVVAEAFGISSTSPDPPSGSLMIDFPLVIARREFEAKVVCWHPVDNELKPSLGGSEDIAVLEVALPDEFAEKTKPIRLINPNSVWKHAFRAFGFPASYDSGVWAVGELLDGQANGWIQIEGLNQAGYFVTQGFSGAAVWDDLLEGVVGMVVVADKRPEVRAGFMIPTAGLINAWPELSEHIGSQPVSRVGGSSPEKISIGRLPITSSKLFGRESEVNQLDGFWADNTTNVVTLIAWGGVGKSALLNYWLRILQRDNYRGAERVYGWSFYRQGTSERVVSADEFIAAALTWFDDADPNRGTPWEKGERLASLIRTKRTLLVLDGLEPLQFPPGPQEGKLKDQALQALLRELAGSNPGLCLISSRINVADLAPFERESVARMDLEHLSPHAGVLLLKDLGVTGDEREIEQAAQEYGGHSLALTLLGSYLTDVHDGDVRLREDVSLEDDVRYGSQAQGVMAAYERWFGFGSPETAVLRLLGLFDRPADQSAVAALRAEPTIAGLTDSLRELNSAQWQQVLSKLRRSRLLAEPAQDEKSLDTHPLVREHFGRQLKRDSPVAWREGNDRLYEHFRKVAKQFPETIQEMEPLFMAVVYGCNAGRHRDALHDVYLPRIMRGEKAYAARQLGAYGALLAVLVYFCEDHDWNKPWDPKPPEHQGLDSEDQLTVLGQAGLFLTATKGYASNELKPCYDRVKQLSIRLGKMSRLYPVLISEWRSALVTQELSKSRKLANDVYSLAQEQNDPALLIGAYRALSMTEFYAGEFGLARTYAEKGIDLWDTKRASNMVDEIYTPVVTCLAIDAMLRWHFGKPRESLERIRQAIALARELGDLNALAAPALFMCCYINHFRNEPEDTIKSSDELIEVSSSQGFALWLSLGKIHKGWGLAVTAEAQEGLALLNQGIQDFLNLGAGINACYFFCLLTGALLHVGEAKQALLSINKAHDYACRFGERWWLAEIFRLQGEALLKDGNAVETAEKCFTQALEVSRSQGSKSLELRSLLSLYRLKRTLGDAVETSVALQQLCDSFGAGLDTYDLREARRLLSQEGDSPVS